MSKETKEMNFEELSGLLYIKCSISKTSK